MKKITLLLTLITILFVGKAQDEPTWYNLALKGGMGNSILFTANYSSDMNVEYNYFTSSYFYGLDAGVTFPGGFSLGLEYSIAKFGQEYDINNVGAYTKHLKLYSHDVLFLIRAFDDSFGYFEIGPKLSLMKKIDEANSDDRLFTNTLDNYNDNFISIMFGFGIPVFVGDIFDFSIGLRAGYSVTNLMKDEDYTISDIGFTNDYTSYSTTNPFFAQITFRFNWHIGITAGKNSWE